MFWKRDNKNSLAVPPLADENKTAVEVLRAWAASGQGQQLAFWTTWKDPGAWGLLVVDIARHVAQAYQAEGRTPDEVMSRIRELWDAEWAKPTDSPREVTPNS